MNFDPFCLFDHRPALLEFRLHLLPNLLRISLPIFNFLLCGRLQLIKSKNSLNQCNFSHKTPESSIISQVFIATPCCLEFDGSKDWATMTFEHDFRLFHGFDDLCLIDDA